MDSKQASEIVECLPRGRTLFPYFPGRYALLLLARLAGTGRTVREIKQTRYAPLLEKPSAKEVVRRSPDGRLTAQRVLDFWPAVPEVYRLTLGLWGDAAPRDWTPRWDQTSRPGLNLVLQVNFSEKHNRPYRRLDPEGMRPFVYEHHPVAEAPEHTLSWARLDVDLDSGEALIEEIQSDWIGLANWFTQYFDQCVDHVTRCDSLRATFATDAATPERFEQYRWEVLAPHRASWQEVTLAAALWFLRDELGISRVYFHTFSGGNASKGLRLDCAPPRSIYSALPRRFCFSETEQAPTFLADCRNKRVRRMLQHSRPRWFVQDL